MADKDADASDFKGDELVIDPINKDICSKDKGRKIKVVLCIFFAFVFFSSILVFFLGVFVHFSITKNNPCNNVFIPQSIQTAEQPDGSLIVTVNIMAHNVYHHKIGIASVDCDNMGGYTLMLTEMSDSSQVPDSLKAFEKKYFSVSYKFDKKEFLAEYVDSYKHESSFSNPDALTWTDEEAINDFVHNCYLSFYRSGDNKCMNCFTTNMKQN